MNQPGRRGHGRSLTWGPDGPETSGMRICRLEVHDDLDEEDARPQEGERATDDPSGDFIDNSKDRAARKEETKFMNEIEFCEHSAAKDRWRSTGKPPVSTRWIGGQDRVWWPTASRRKATMIGCLVRTHTAAGRDQGGAGLGQARSGRRHRRTD